MQSIATVMLKIGSCRRRAGARPVGAG